MDNTTYTPADDENQGVMTKLMQGEAAGGGVSQAEYMNPIVNQGPEPEKDEVNDADDESIGINDDLLAEEEVEDGLADDDE
ncbi:hypothetical protein [Spirosoma linguale]|uniref:Uncharacterized protein n=1 Tax=Spirosoma linguale (strain ATCC 33905 / DSM 74 / LMG 10896 / Claus 1) TaxID=504472 RepID=D2QR56_SPILD|nr:hypothetical protein Slin_3603 [Spirosoma linguale DSM 74]